MTGPPRLEETNLHFPKWVDMLNRFKKSKAYGGDGVDWNEELREKVRRDQGGEASSSQQGSPGWQQGKGFKAGPPSSSQGGKSRSSANRVPEGQPPKAPPKARPDTPRSRQLPRPLQNLHLLSNKKEWYSSAPPEGIVAVEMLGKDYDGHNSRYILWAERKSQHMFAPAPIAGPRTKMHGEERQW